MKKLYFTFLTVTAFLSSFSVLAQDVFRGRVLNTADEPLARALVEVYDESENLLYSQLTDEQGNFETDITIESTPGVTSNKRLLTDDFYLSYVYPNPAKEAPLHFKFRSKDGQMPEITFFTFDGKRVKEGDLLSPGTYVYRAEYQTNPKANSTNGLFSISQNMVLEVELIPLQASSPVTTAPEENSNQRITTSTQVEGTFRVAITKDEFVTLSEEVDTDIPANIDKDYQLELAPKPTVNFDIITDLGTKEGDIIKFDASASVGANNEELKFFWDFGDQAKASQSQIPHIYVNPGTYTVSLTAIGAYGAKETSTKTVEITALEDPGTTAAVRGIISDATGAPLDSATVNVAAMDTTFYTNEMGEVAFDGFPSGFPVMIEIAKEGYVSEMYKMNVQQEARQSYFELSLISREPVIVLTDVELGGEVTGKDGNKVQLPAEALLHADGSIVTGEVDVYITPIDISDDNQLDAFPGSFSGITFEGEAPLILSYGTSDLTFMQNDEELQLAAGKTATVELTIYVENNEFGEPLEEGDEIPLWSYDEASGNWVMEGTGVVTASAESPTGLVLLGEVNHFSWWNCDVAPDPWFPEFDFQFPEDDEGNPEFGVPEDGQPYFSGTPQGGGGPRSRRTSPNCCGPLPTPPDVPILFFASAGNGLYEGETTASGSAGSSTTVVIDMNRVANYGELAGEIAPDTLFTTAIEEAGNIDAFTVNQPIGTILVFSVQPSVNSTLGGTVEIRDPDNLPVDKKSFSSASSASFTFEVTKTGDYQLIVDGTENEPGAYTANLSTYQTIEMNTNTADQIEVDGQQNSYIFAVEQDQLINVAVESAFNGRIYLRLYNADKELLAQNNSSNYIESGIVKAEEDGFFTLELESATNGARGAYILGLSEILQPTPFDLNEVLTKVERQVNVIGNRQYFVYNEPEKASRKYAIHTLDSLAATFRVLRPGSEPFYERAAIESLSTTNYNEASKWSKSPVIQLQDTGDYVLELNPVRLTQIGTKLGGYELFVMKPEVTPITIGDQISDSISNFFGRINEFRQYTFEATEGQMINAAVASEISGRSYLRLYDPDTIRLKNIRSSSYIETGVYRAEKTGTYLLELDGVDAGSQGNFELGLPSIEAPTPINPVQPYFRLDGEVNIIGDKQFYSFTDTTNARLNLAFKTGNGLTAGLRLLRPGSQEFFARTQIFNIRTTDNTRWESYFRQTNLPDNGEYIVEVDPNSTGLVDTKTGTFEFLVLKPEEAPIAINSQLDDSLRVFFGQVNEAKHFIFSGTQGQLVNAAYTDDISGRNYIRLLDKDNNELASVRDGQQLGVRALPYTGMYRIELEGVDRDRSQGSFTLGLTTAEPPVPINFQSPFTTVDDQVGIVGKHKYYSIQVDSLERFNFGVLASDSFRTALEFRRMSADPFYQRPRLRSGIFTGGNGSTQTGPISLNYGGEIILEINPDLRPENADGSYQLYVGQRAIQNIALNAPVQGSISRDLGIFIPANRYQFTSPASNTINVNFSWDSASSSRVYIRIFALDGEQIYSSRTYSTGSIALPANGDYLLEIEFIDNPNGDFTFTVNEE